MNNIHYYINAMYPYTVLFLTCSRRLLAIIPIRGISLPSLNLSRLSRSFQVKLFLAMVCEFPESRDLVWGPLCNERDRERERERESVKSKASSSRIGCTCCSNVHRHAITSHWNLSLFSVRREREREREREPGARTILRSREDENKSV